MNYVWSAYGIAAILLIALYIMICRYDKTV